MFLSLKKIFVVFAVLDRTTRPNPRDQLVSCGKILTHVANVSMKFSLGEQRIHRETNYPHVFFLDIHWFAMLPFIRTFFFQIWTPREFLFLALSSFWLCFFKVFIDSCDVFLRMWKAAFCFSAAVKCFFCFFCKLVKFFIFKINIFARGNEPNFTSESVRNLGYRATSSGAGSLEHVSFFGQSTRSRTRFFRFTLVVTHSWAEMGSSDSGAAASDTRSWSGAEWSGVERMKWTDWSGKEPERLLFSRFRNCSELRTVLQGQ